jgi:hypothetical protein
VFEHPARSVAAITASEQFLRRAGDLHFLKPFLIFVQHYLQRPQRDGARWVRIYRDDVFFEDPAHPHVDQARARQEYAVAVIEDLSVLVALNRNGEKLRFEGLQRESVAPSEGGLREQGGVDEDALALTVMKGDSARVDRLDLHYLITGDCQKPAA